MKAAEVSRASWSTFGKHGCATLFGADGSSLLKLDGFARRDQETLGGALKDQGVALSDVEFCSSGVNRGKHSFEDGQRLVVHQTAPGEGKEPKRLFDIDLSKVSQCVLPAGVGKQAGEQKEVTMQFDDKAAPDDHQLVELRLYIPPGSRSYAEDEEEDDDDAGEAARVHAKIMEYSKLTSVTGTQLAQFGAEDGAFLCGNQIFNPTSMCAYATVSTQGFLLCFENSTRAIDSSKNQPNRLRFDRAREV